MVDPGLCLVALSGAVVAAIAVASPERALAVWLAASPWANYVARYPSTRSALTFDRVALAAVVAGFAWRRRRTGRGLPGPMLCEVGWAGYAGVAVLSVVALSADKGFALRIALDALVLPLALFSAVRVEYDRDAGRAALFWGAVALALSLPWVGAAELLTGADLLPFAGGSIVRSDVVRPNGPFANDVEYATAAAVLAVFLVHAPRLLGVEPRGVARLARAAAVAAALLTTALPLFRTLAFAVVAALAVPALVAGSARTLARRAVVAALALVAASPLVAVVATTHAFEDRVTDPSSVYSRVATLRAGARIVADHPLLGVGLANYSAYFDRALASSSAASDEVEGVGPERSPHNDPLGVWAELGLGGIFCYLLAAVGAYAAARRRGDVAAAALLVVYTVPGLTLRHGINPGPNLLLAVALGVAFSRRAEAA